jgi:hypothetical protein
MAYAVMGLSHFQQRASAVHLQLFKHIARYLLGNHMYGIVFRQPLVTQTNALTGVSSVFSDTDHAGDMETRQSKTGWVIMLYWTAIAWESRLQLVVAKSTTAAEIIAASTATDEAVHCQKLLRDLETPVEPMTLRVNIQAALRRMNNEIEDGLPSTWPRITCMCAKRWPVARCNQSGWKQSTT